MADVEDVGGGNCASITVKRQRQYLNLYYNSAQGSVPWQMDMLRTTALSKAHHISPLFKAIQIIQKELS